jgi:hypothetical protein
VEVHFSPEVRGETSQPSEYRVERKRVVTYGRPAQPYGKPHLLERSMIGDILDAKYRINKQLGAAELVMSTWQLISGRLASSR